MKESNKIHLAYASFLIHVYNFMQKMHPHLSDEDIELIKNTHLFDHLNEKEFNKLLKSAKLVKFIADKLIFQEGDLPDALYIIVDGSVRVFTYDAHGEKLPLARLNKGNYFGEQAILAPGSKTRNASIETIDETTVIQIEAKLIEPLWQENHDLKLKLNKIGYEQAIHAISSSVPLYRDIQSIFEQIEKYNITELADGTTIFKVGDKPDHIYFILQGTVKITKPENKLTSGQESLTLHRGHFFGELGVIENKPRSATAIAAGKVRLLVIEGEQFKAIYQKNPLLQHLLASFKQLYRIPLRGMVEQYIDDKSEMGSVITTLFQMNDGRSIIAIRSLTQNIFTMTVSAKTPQAEYKFTQKDLVVKLLLAERDLVGIEVGGEWQDLPHACQALLDKQILEDKTIDKFIKTGVFPLKLPLVETEIICNCMSVSRKQLQDLIDNGMTTLDSLANETGAGTVCGACRNQILCMLNENPWSPAILQRIIEHNDHIRSYIIKPCNSDFKIKEFHPGQFVMVQAKIKDVWVERAYTISDIFQEDQVLRVTIKKEPKGLFSQWLFAETAEQINVNISQPQGFFCMNEDSKLTALCFAGGVGVTPFITYAKSLKKLQNNKRMHILYCALTKNDFIFTNEFNEAVQATPTLTITFRDNDTNGLLSENDIIQLVQSLNEPEIYICGPEGFTDLINKTLQSIQYDSKKIFIEKFVHAGASH